jgi:hypothetical protein
VSSSKDEREKGKEETNRLGSERIGTKDNVESATGPVVVETKRGGSSFSGFSGVEYLTVREGQWLAEPHAGWFPG